MDDPPLVCAARRAYQAPQLLQFNCIEPSQLLALSQDFLVIKCCVGPQEVEQGAPQQSFFSR